MAVNSLGVANGTINFVVYGKEGRLGRGEGRGEGGVGAGGRSRGEERRSKGRRGRMEERAKKGGEEGCGLHQGR